MLKDLLEKALEDTESPAEQPSDEVLLASFRGELDESQEDALARGEMKLK